MDVESARYNRQLLDSEAGRALFAYGDAMQLAAGLFGSGWVPIACTEMGHIYTRVFQAMGKGLPGLQFDPSKPDWHRVLAVSVNGTTPSETASIPSPCKPDNSTAE